MVAASRAGLQSWGMGAAIQGGMLVPLSFVGLGAAVRVAEILLAEDFDRLGWEPTWFRPWRLVMHYPGIGIGVLSAVGIAVVLAGAMCVRDVKGSARWLEWACWAAAVCCCLLVAAQLPLWVASGGWPTGTPADRLRRRLLMIIIAGGAELICLLGTAVIIHKARPSASRAPAAGRLEH